MADIYYHKSSELSSTPLPAHTTGTRPAILSSLPPTTVQVEPAELGIGYYRSDPALYIQNDDNQIVKFAYVSHEAQPGLIEIAEQQEADGGIDDYRALTPLKLSQFAGTFHGDLSFDGDVTFKTLEVTDQAIINDLQATNIKVDHLEADTARIQNDIYVGGNINGPGGLPPGLIMAFAGSAVPTGWLECNGQSVSRAAYAKLFAAIGTTYGSRSAGEFSLPDLQGQFIRGVSGGGVVGATQAYSTARPRNDFTGSASSVTQTHTHSFARLSASNGGEHGHSGRIAAAPNHSHSGTTNYSGPTRVNTNSASNKVTFATAWIGNDQNQYSERGVDITQGDESGTYTAGSGTHSHSLDIPRHRHSFNTGGGGGHTHSFSMTTGGAHTHSLSGSLDKATMTHTHTIRVAGGDAETRPQNMALMYCIKI